MKNCVFYKTSCDDSFAFKIKGMKSKKVLFYLLTTFPAPMATV